MFKIYSSKLLLEWMAKRFTCSTFINYEQIHPTDGFGQIMLNHFKKLQCTLHSVNHYPNCASHCSRYKENVRRLLCVNYIHEI